MNPEVKEKWIKALISGEYEQGMGGLRREVEEGDIKYCCLGVLCEIYRIEKKQSEWRQYEPGWFSYMQESGILPEKVMKWAGLEDPQGTFYRESEPADYLIKVNDIEKKSFKQIAEIIEKYF
jgi:hypothetical protein